jgi:hypothetical protein
MRWKPADGLLYIVGKWIYAKCGDCRRLVKVSGPLRGVHLCEPRL